MILKNSSRIALVYENQQVTYEDLIKRSLYLASVIDVKNDKSVIFMENRPEWVYSLFSSWENSCSAVLIDAGSTEDEVEYILKDSSPKVLFCSNQTVKSASDVVKNINQNIKIINVDDLDFYNFSENGRDLDYTHLSDKVAVLIYTSGTTGDPKGVMLTHANLRADIEGVAYLGVVNQYYSILALLSFHHAYPLTATLLTPLFLENKVVISNDLSSKSIFSLLNEHKIDIMIGVPRLYSLLGKGVMRKVESSKLSKRMFSLMKKVRSRKIRKQVFSKVHKAFGGNIKAFISGGAKLDIEVAKKLDILGFNVLEGYGLTETSPIASFNTLKHNKIGSVGRPLKGVEIKSVDGEIAIKGPIVMKGYYNKQAETDEAIRDGWFYTGDLGNVDDEGYVTITGRKKEIIVLPNGKNINPSVLEDQILSKVDIIKEIGVYEDNGLLSAIIVPDFEELSKDKVLNISEKIKWSLYDNYNVGAPSYRKIQKYYIIDGEIPKTRLGKIRRFMLPDLAVQKKIANPAKEPTDEVYKLIKQYLIDTKDVDVSIDSHLELDLGMDSLDNADMQNFVSKAFGVELSSEKFAEIKKLKDFHRYILDNKKFISNDMADWVKEIEDFEINKTNVPLLRTLQGIIRPSLKLYFKLEVKGLDRLKEGQNYIFAPNHPTYIDAYIVASSFPTEIAKETFSLGYYTFFQSKVMKYLADNVNIIPIDIDRNLREVLVKLENVLESKKNLLIFPEGAVSRDGNIQELKPLFAMLSLRQKTPIVPIIIKGAYDAMPFGTKIPKPKKITVEILKPVHPDKFENANDMKEHIQKLMETNLKKA